MYYYWNKLREYLWGWIERRIEECENRLEMLETDILYLYNKTNEHDDDGYESDGSNLGIFIKSRINDDTQLQYITGPSDRYDTRKKLYMDMEKIIDRKEENPRVKIKEYNELLQRAGFEVSKITDNTLIIKGGTYENVKDFF
ncbi:38.8K [Diatraea saccharalis granulovirus]|uniref:38.8K n=1 Tax=Diatraea saccharalis granulovirus TaxID=1675862 RepID=A0A0R7EYY9_9BBAC|nr:38.8K [Diatraea saccharalis granulovirus]AKN80798.1 38.8K [Diatraea saccharalis granulovirus]